MNYELQMRKEETSPGNSQFAIRNSKFAIRNSKFARRGSALLIVLGMLAFMVVSAVGFSVYMRQSRAPSSYLRRNVASRYLVKAALANAIEELEGAYNEDRTWGIRENERTGSSSNQDYLPDNHFYGVFDDPYPGCGRDNRDFPSNPKGNGDYWLKRVFCPFGPVREPTSESQASDEETRETMANPTVPTLTLEALAYLPPAIVDDVRKVSRLTRTACWRPLPYETGRYAYTAVNVSDLFDINRLMAEPRNSSPAGRVSLVSLAGTDATSPTTLGSPDALDTAASKWESSSPSTPFVSLADFALANAGTDYSPFSKFIGSAGDQLLQGGNAAEANSLFVTDTWFPTSNSVNGVTYDLAAGHQPFKPNAFNGTKLAGFDLAADQLNTQDGLNDIFEKNLGVGVACLWDYLDRDHQPLSLCLPTTEAVPMVLGVSAPDGLQLEYDNVGEPQTGEFEVDGYYLDPDGTKIPAKVTIKRTCQAKGIRRFGNQIFVRCLAAYPFKRMQATGRVGSYKYRGVLRVWLAPAGMGCRPGTVRSLGLGKDDNARNGIGMISDKLNSAKYGVATFLTDSFLSGQTMNKFTSDVKTWSDAVEPIDLQFRNLEVNMPVCQQVTEEIVQNMPGKTLQVDAGKYSAEPYFTLGDILNKADSLRPLAVNGNFDTDWQNAANAAKFNLGVPYPDGVTPMPELPAYRLYASVWVQILENDKVVDMVPACYEDDIDWLEANLGGQNEIVNRLGDGAPLLNFQAEADISYAKLQENLAAPPTFGAKSLYAVDPRYNWAPEAWYSTTEQYVDKGSWHTAMESFWGTDGRDRDIFMFVSDQEYLQDIGELQFLPFVQRMNGSGDFIRGDYSPNYHGNALSARTTPAQVAQNFERGINFLWRTYTAYDNGDGYDPIYALPPNATRIRSGGTGFKLNPYSDDDRVLFAALVGTPFDYYVASTNTDSQVKNAKCSNIDLATMMSTYSFGQSAVAKLTDDELSAIGAAIRDTFQNAANNGNANWEAAWEQLMSDSWQEDALKCDENNKFLGETLGTTLHGVDRKFLASFWRECFDNRQQLFLVVVRAEPTSVGGGAADAMASAQLGGRAVALVWRDPTVPTYKIGQRKLRSEFRSRNDSTRESFRQMKKECPPHRTRILFYHQFD